MVDTSRMWSVGSYLESLGQPQNYTKSIQLTLEQQEIEMHFNSVHSLSYIRLFGRHGLQYARLPCTSTTPGACSNSCPSNPSYPLLSPSSPAFIFLSIRVFSSESVLPIWWPKYWSFSFSISPSSEYSGLISFRIDWLDLLAVQGTLKSLLQHHSSKA